MEQGVISLLTKIAAKTASVPAGASEIKFFSDLQVFMFFAIPIISTILAIFIWKRSRIARVLTTLFIVIAWLFVIFFAVPLIPMLIPTLLGAVVLYYLWFNKKTSVLFGPSV